MLDKTMKLVAMCALLAAGCTTDFSKTDATVDGTPDTGGDGPGDAPGDVVPDGPLPEVECSIIREEENAFGDGTPIPFGCDAFSGDCYGTAIWIMERGVNLVVIHGTEDLLLDPGAHLIANMLGVGDLSVRAEMPIYDTMSYETMIRSSTILERTHDWDVLLVPAVDEFAEGGPFWNIRRVAIDITGLDSMDYNEQLLFEPGVPDSMGALLYPRGVFMPGTSSLHVLVQLTNHDGFETNQLHGATLSRTEFEDGGLVFSDTFHPMQPDMDGTFYMGRPDESAGTLAIPFMEIDAVEATVRGGLWVQHGPITSTTLVHSLLHESDRSITAAVAGAFVAPGTYASAAITSDSEFVPEAPLAPPYQLGSKIVVGDEIDGSSVMVTDVFEQIDYAAASDTNTWDVADTMMLYDSTTGFQHYVIPLYASDGNALVGVFPMREDGSAGGEPLFVPTGQNVMPAFDATINPETGAIYLARHMQTDSPDAVSDIPGFVITEINCTLIED